MVLKYLLYNSAKIDCGIELLQCSSIGRAIFILLGEILWIFDLKNMISTYAEDFWWKKNGPISLDFERKKFQIVRFFLMMSSSR
jgi:hypothetical protein